MKKKIKINDTTSNCKKREKPLKTNAKSLRSKAVGIFLKKLGLLSLQYIYTLLLFKHISKGKDGKSTPKKIQRKKTQLVSKSGIKKQNWVTTRRKHCQNTFLIDFTSEYLMNVNRLILYIPTRQDVLSTHLRCIAP